jgi:thioredoxin reductase (NADPH)
MKKERVIVVGSGPAGLTAALYAARDQLEPLVIAGPTIGGQVSLTNEVENYPGFPEGLGGPDLVEKMQKQAEKFGARFEFDEVTELELPDGGPFYVKTYGQEYEADALILTMGASPRLLKVPGEQEFTGRGVSYCATCDGAFFRGRPVAVVGNNDEALEETLFLTKFASHITLVVPTPDIKAQHHVIEEVTAHPSIDVRTGTRFKAVEGEEQVTAIRVQPRDRKEEEVIAVDGVFVFLQGARPITDYLMGQLDTTENGCLKVDRELQTSIPGVFAVGDLICTHVKQAVIAASDGVIAAIAVDKYVHGRKKVKTDWS